MARVLRRGQRMRLAGALEAGESVTLVRRAGRRWLVLTAGRVERWVPQVRLVGRTKPKGR